MNTRQSDVENGHTGEASTGSGGVVGLSSAERAAWADDIASVPDVEDFVDPWDNHRVT